MLGLLAVSFAAAGAAAAAEELLPGGALEPTESSTATSSPPLDLHIDTRDLLSLGGASSGADALAADRAERYSRAEPESDRGLSFDFEVKPRSPLGRLARQSDIQDPTLTDQLQKVIEQPAFGVRGRYRF